MSGAPEVAARRWALVIEYDGSGYVGWQHQANGVSVQEVIEAASARLSGGRHVTCQVAGRTDAGVHAAGQVISLDLPDPGGGPWQADRLRDALNFHLRPHPIVALRATAVTTDFHPRFSAVGRLYRYRILNRPVRPALDNFRVWHVARPLDAATMAEAARALLGRHDFTSFRAAACQARNPVRTLDRLDVARAGDLVTVEAEARSFLHHQVRNMVGTLALVGAGRWPASRVTEALSARDRRRAGPTAPPEGLCLLRVVYDPDPFSASPWWIPPPQA